MSKNSDIIKIGFDYRSSLEQFEKETNGVFDEVSNRAGKQKIVLQLDAKDDKLVEKIKELQKLKLDKFTFEFGDSGLKEQLQTFDRLEGKINEIIKLSKSNLKSVFNDVKNAASLDGLSYGTDEYNNELKRVTSSIVEMGKKGQNSTREYFIEVQKLLNLYELFRKRADGNLFNKNMPQANKFNEFIKNSQLTNDLDPLKDTTSDIFNGCLVILDNFVDVSTRKFLSLKDVIEKVISVGGELKSIADINVGKDNDINPIIDQQVNLQDELKETQKRFENVKRTAEELKKELLDIANKTGALKSTDISSALGLDKDFVNKDFVKLTFGGYTPEQIIDYFLKFYEDAEQAKESIKDLNDELKETKSTSSSVPQESNIPSGMKDAFPDKDVSASVEKIADGFKEAKQETEEATESAKDYVRTISQVGEWNVDSKVSVVKERNDGQLETWNYDAKRGKKDITYDKDGNINYGDPIITTISNYKQLEQTIVKADDKLRDLRKALEDIKEINPNASTKNIEKQIQYQKEYISLLEQTVKVISQGDEYFLNEQQIIDARKKATTEYDLKQGTKSDISNAKQSAKANEQAIRQEQKLTNELRKQEEQARKTALSYTESASKKLSNAISKYSYGNSSDATAMMKQMNRGLSNFGDLSNIESNIKNFDSVVDSIITDLKRSHEDALSSLNSEIKAEETMQKQKDAFNKSNLNAIDMEIKKREEETKAFSNSLKAQMESQQQAESQMSKFENTLSKYKTKTSGYNATIARFKDGGWTSDEYLKNVQAVENAVQKYENLLSNIKAKGGIASEEDVQNLKEYESEIKKTISTVTNMSASEKGYNFVSGQKELDKIHKLLNENSKMSSEAKAKIKAYYAEIESGNPSMSLDRIHGEIMKIYNAEVEAGRAGRSFFDTLKNSGFHQLAAQMAGMFGLYDAINLGKEAISTIVSLDDALVDLKKTTAMNSTQLEQYYYDANDVAKQMGVTTEEIINQSSAWSRLGYNTAEASTEMAKLSSQFASISPGMEVDEAQSGLVSIMKAWSIDPDQVKSEIMDPINQLGNTMAEDNQDIVEGMERSAAALAAVGTSTKDAFALFSGIQEVLQNAEKSGTSLKSVALRLRSFDETTGEYSEDLANITGELIDLTKTAKHAEGVSIFKPGSTTEFKDLTDYFREIAGIWDEMTQKQQNDFLIKAFGRNQAQAGAALIQNFKAVDKALAEMGESAGSSDKEMEAVESSLSYKINALKETWVGCVQDMIDRGDLGTIVTGLTKVSEAITFLLDKLGILGSIGLGAGIFSGIKNVGRDKMYSLSF